MLEGPQNLKAYDLYSYLIFESVQDPSSRAATSAISSDFQVVFPLAELLHSRDIDISIPTALHALPRTHPENWEQDLYRSDLKLSSILFFMVEVKRHWALVLRYPKSWCWQLGMKL